MCTKVKTGSSKAAAEGAKEGSITVFLALSLTLLAAIFLSTVEAARTQGARTYFTLICNSGIDSLFSQYHLKLWEDYRLLGLLSPEAAFGRSCRKDFDHGSGGRDI